MALPVKLGDVVNEMDVFGDEWTAYINRKTGELCTITDDEAREAEEPDEDEDEEPDDAPGADLDPESKIKEVVWSGDFRRLPSRSEINEWSIMARFADSLDDDDASERLQRALHGRGAFRYFKDVLHELGITQDWYDFRYKSLAEIARQWLLAHGIPFVEQAGDDAEGAG